MKNELRKRWGGGKSDKNANFSLSCKGIKKVNKIGESKVRLD